MAKNKIRVVLDGLEKEISESVKRVTLAVTAELQRATPVDTGWARANWVPSIGVSFQGIPVQDDKAAKEASVGAAKSAQAQGVAAVAALYTANMGSVFITNNVSYIVNLDQGSSTQAPSGFVRAAILKASRE